jgi:hypothetical protein
VINPANTTNIRQGWCEFMVVLSKAEKPDGQQVIQIDGGQQVIQIEKISGDGLRELSR